MTAVPSTFPLQPKITSRRSSLADDYATPSLLPYLDLAWYFRPSDLPFSPYAHGRDSHQTDDKMTLSRVTECGQGKRQVGMKVEVKRNGRRRRVHGHEEYRW